MIVPNPLKTVRHDLMGNYDRTDREAAQDWPVLGRAVFVATAALNRLVQTKEHIARGAVSQHILCALQARSQAYRNTRRTRW